jgi:hypothetical protein
MRALALVLLFALAQPALAQSRAAEEAMTAYRAHIERTAQESDEEAYLSAFAPRLECLYGELDAPRERLRNRTYVPAAIAELHVVEATANEVTLVDRGWYAQDGTVGLHEKVVRMRRDGERWLIVGESGARSDGCLREYLTRAPPPSPRFVDCRHAAQPMIREVNRMCATESVHGCALLSQDTGAAIEGCFEGRSLDLGSVPHVAIPDVPWSQLSYRYPASGTDARFVSVAFGDVDRDGSQDAVVTLAVDDGFVLEAYARRNGLFRELGTVLELIGYTQGAAPPDVRSVQIQRGVVAIDATSCDDYRCTTRTASVRRLRIRGGRFVPLP